MADLPSKAPPAGYHLLVASLRSLRTHEERVHFLKDILANAAALLSHYEGEEQAAEAVYRLADAMVAAPRPDSI